ncbi:MAG: hypothetical protein JWQ32_58 [Marmoricola sp.]|nr:hypothetical protein [Marmoricola sp.]
MTTDTDTGRVRASRWAPRAWWIVYVAVVIVGVALDDLRLRGVPSGARMAVSVVAGIALGAFWYRTNPRPLAHRLFPLACVFVVWMAFASFDFQAERLGPNLVIPGVLAGLVFAEVYVDLRPWGHQKRTALTSHKTTADLR